MSGGLAQCIKEECMSIALRCSTSIVEPGVVLFTESDGAVQNLDKGGRNFDGGFLEGNDMFSQRDKVFDSDRVGYWSCWSVIGSIVLGCQCINGVESLAMLLLLSLWYFLTRYLPCCIT